MTAKPSLLIFVAVAVLRRSCGDPGTRRAPAQTRKPITTLTSPVTGNAVAGRLYYDHACYSCHGFNGETGAPVRAQLAGEPGH